MICEVEKTFYEKHQENTLIATFFHSPKLKKYENTDYVCGAWILTTNLNWNPDMASAAAVLWFVWDEWHACWRNLKC